MSQAISVVHFWRKFWRTDIVCLYQCGLHCKQKSGTVRTKRNRSSDQFRFTMAWKELAGGFEIYPSVVQRPESERSNNQRQAKARKRVFAPARWCEPCYCEHVWRDWQQGFSCMATTITDREREREGDTQCRQTRSVRALNQDMAETNNSDNKMFKS